MCLTTTERVLAVLSVWDENHTLGDQHWRVTGAVRSGSRITCERVMCTKWREGRKGTRIPSTSVAT